MDQQHPSMTESSLGVVFDLDGVIVDTKWAHQQAVELLCRNHGCAISAERFQARVFGRRNHEWIPEIFGANLSTRHINQLSEEKEVLFRRIYAPAVALLPGLMTFLGSLKDYGVPAAVATSAPLANLELILARTGIADRFAVMLDAASVSAGKPDPQIYLLAARQLRLSPTRCIVFEDSLPGVEAARRAGSRVVGVSTMHTRAELLAADLVIRDFEGLTVPAVRQLVSKK